MADQLSFRAGFHERACGMAFPMWAKAGFDRERGRFEERLSLRGARVRQVPIRLMS
jgi:mannose/cellobiose epimerase-like protein (N-acyl-D-glucosamine 2-epimerase family)